MCSVAITHKKLKTAMNKISLAPILYSRCRSKHLPYNGRYIQKSISTGLPERSHLGCSTFICIQLAGFRTLSNLSKRKCFLSTTFFLWISRVSLLGIPNQYNPINISENTKNRYFAKTKSGASAEKAPRKTSFNSRTAIALRKNTQIGNSKPKYNDNHNANAPSNKFIAFIFSFECIWTGC